ncbi:MAG: SPASM domain-containing protein, partial [Desulfobulbaceae bacterium]|nr:SPASM domain-containing protein [Desulfobulbaceae bacterium]
SINGYSKKVHEQIMRGVKHEKVLENIANFTKMRRELKANGPILEAVFFKSPENEHEEELFKREMQTIVDYVHPIVGISQQFANTGAGSGFVRNKTCKNLWERMTVYWNGDVTMCFSDLDGNYILGNLQKNSIKEIWNSDKLLSIRGIHKKGLFQDIELCAKCDLKSV